MEPTIPDGSFCLFRGGAALGGSRNGKIVLVKCLGMIDPDTQTSFTVKRYRSRKEASPEGEWEHESITLEALNPSHKPILLTPDNMESFAIIGEFVRVLRRES